MEFQPTPAAWSRNSRLLRCSLTPSPSFHLSINNPDTFLLSFSSQTPIFIQLLHAWQDMRASLYTSGFSSLLNIVNATQPADLLSCDFNEAAPMTWDILLLIHDSVGLVLVKCNWGRKIKCLLQLCCKLKARPTLDAHRKEASSLWRAHLGLIRGETGCCCVSVGTPGGLKLVAPRQDNTGGNNSKRIRQSIYGEPTYRKYSSQDVIKAEEKVLTHAQGKNALKANFNENKHVQIKHKCHPLTKTLR